MRNLILIISFLIVFFQLNAQDVYVLNSDSKIQQMERNAPSGMKFGGGGGLAVFGKGMTSSFVVNGAKAEITVPMGASYFYLKIPRQVTIKSFFLIPLTAKKKERHLTYMKTGLYSGTETDYHELPIDVNKLTEGVYSITPKETLKPGEYAIVKMDNGVPTEIYDFRIDASLSPSLDIPKSQDIIAALGATESSSSSPTSTLIASNNDSPIIDNARQLSDVDIDIPLSKKKSENTFALIISNENYKQVENVPYALNDGKTFKQYCKLTLGMNDKQIQHLENASLSDIKFAINRLKDICEAYEGDVKVLVHYSGHGIPDESNSEGYLLPVDGYASDPSTALKVSDFYDQLSSLPSKSTIVFLDACFSGTKRSGEMLASARGVAIKAKEAKPSGKLIVLAAAQGDQTAYPYEEKQHGLMTYFLLKKLKESNGEAPLGEIADYVTSNVKKVSIVENGKSQVPTVSFDATNDQWGKQTLR